MGKLDGKVALVTGANRGIGRSIARGFAREGARLTTAARDAALLEEAAAELREMGAEVLAIPTDVTDEAQMESLFSQHMERYGRLDVLVNNAGAFDGGALDELTLAAWDKVMAVNLRGPFLGTRAAMRIMKPQGGGRIINVGSISAQRVRMNSAPYSTSKHGIWGLTQCTALEGRPYGISACALHPGNALTERRAESTQPQDREPMMTTDELAETAVFMACQPPHVCVLEAIVLPVEQLYVGRG